MRYDTSLLKADIKDELAKIAMIVAEYKKHETTVAFPSEKVSFYHRGAIGYILHNFYNGCENIFKSIAKYFENDLGPQSWHKNLLKRMRIEVPGFRPRVINEELYLLLDDFRSFRHKFRHTYAFELDWEREQLVARKLSNTAEMFEHQINNFLKHLEQIADVQTDN